MPLLWVLYYNNIRHYNENRFFHLNLSLISSSIFDKTKKDFVHSYDVNNMHYEKNWKVKWLVKVLIRHYSDGIEKCKRKLERITIQWNTLLSFCPFFVNVLFVGFFYSPCLLCIVWNSYKDVVHWNKKQTNTWFNPVVIYNWYYAGYSLLYVRIVYAVQLKYYSKRFSSAYSIESLVNQFYFIQN
jgi:hypothetical protein